MNLSAEQFADIVNTLGAPTRPAEGEQRRAPRVTHRCRAPILLGKDPHQGVKTIVTVRDLSPRGICILHNAEIARGTQFVLQLERAGTAPVHILATVAHCRCQDKSLYVIGAEFTCLLDTAARPALRRGAARDMDRIRRSVLE